MCRWCQLLQHIKEACEVDIFWLTIIEAIGRYSTFNHSGQLENLEDEVEEISWDREYLRVFKNINAYKESRLSLSSLGQDIEAKKVLTDPEEKKEDIELVSPEEFEKDIKDLFAKETSAYKILLLKGQRHQNSPEIDEVDNVVGALSKQRSWSSVKTKHDASEYTPLLEKPVD